MDKRHQEKNDLVKKNYRPCNIIINSTNTDAFTNHKRNLQEKYYNKYDCTRLYTLQLSLMCKKVTQELHP